MYYELNLYTNANLHSGYTQPTIYSGPTITMLPSSHINSTHIQADFRCQVHRTDSSPALCWLTTKY